MTPWATRASHWLKGAKEAHTEFERRFGLHKEWEDFYAVYLDWRQMGYDHTAALNGTVAEFYPHDSLLGPMGRT